MLAQLNVPLVAPNVGQQYIFTFPGQFGGEEKAILRGNVMFN
jgi:hypothetical protein